MDMDMRHEYGGAAWTMDIHICTCRMDMDMGTEMDILLLDRRIRMQLRMVHNYCMCSSKL
jgi:hypothetical protein